MLDAGATQLLMGLARFGRDPMVSFDGIVVERGVRDAFGGIERTRGLENGRKSMQRLFETEI